MPQGTVKTITPNGLDSDLGVCSGTVEADESGGDIIAGYSYDFNHSGSCCRKKAGDRVTILPTQNPNGSVVIVCN